MNIEELLNDQSFRESLENVKNLSEVVELLRSKGLEVTEEQLQGALEAPEGELDESALEGVAGGAKLPKWLQYIVDVLRSRPRLPVRPGRPMPF